MANNVDELIVKTLTKMSNSGEVTAGDILVLKYCKQEKRKKTGGSLNLKSILGGASQVVSFLQTTFGGE